jgi:hypothetical protein
VGIKWVVRNWGFRTQVIPLGKQSNSFMIGHYAVQINGAL